MTRMTFPVLLGLALGSAWPAFAQDTVTVPNPDGQTEAIVTAAEAFFATLSEEEREAVLFAWEDDAQRVNWSNFPTGIFQRAGLRWGDLDEAQHQTLTDLLGTVLSEDGLQMVQEQMLADEVLKQQEAEGGGQPPAGPSPGGDGDGPPAGAPPGGRGGGPQGDLIFGSDEYYVSFLGEPSDAEPWMLQFGRHHLGINATVVGADVTLSPSLTGGQPVRFTWEGEEIDIVVDEVTAAGTLLGSLDEAQREAAVVSDTRIDLVLGPGKDGMTLEPEGLSAAEMTPEQRDLLLALIEARLGMLNADDLAPAMAEIEANLSETSFAWFGPADDPASAYWRVVGPTVILEYSPQEMGGDPSNHLHNMYRDPTNEYGAAWVSP